MQYRICLIAIFLFLSCIPAFAQQPDSVLAVAETKYLQEKIYLHTDKAIYSSGETIWFKAYLAADNLAAPISKTMYAELLTEEGQVLQRKVMPVLLAGASGDFLIPDSLPARRVFIRAYTKWMLNFDSTLLTYKQLQVLPAKASVQKSKAEAELVTLQFFPEGGDWLENIEGIVAFKAVNKQGKPVMVKGDIVGSDNKVAASFATVHNGMGTVLIKPLPGMQYKAVWKDKAGLKQETALPQVKKQGVALSAAFASNSIFYTLTRPDTAAEAFTHFVVVAQMHQRMMYSARINLSRKTTVTAPIAADSLPDGVLQITVFNGDMLPVAERLLFVNNGNYAFITDVHLNEKNLARRGFNSLQLDVGGKILSNLSVAITDAEANPVTPDEDNIYAHFLLTSDLKGRVYNPAYYFSGDADSIKAHADLVMLTNGWRRFKWQELMAGKWPVLQYSPENFLGIQGKVIGLSKTLLHDRYVSGIFKTKTDQPAFINIPLSDKGDFEQDGLFFFDTARLYYQLSNDKDKNLTSAASFSFTSNAIKAPAVSKAFADMMATSFSADSAAVRKTNSMAAQRRSLQPVLGKTQTLQEVKVVTRQKSPAQKLDEKYTSGFFSGSDAYNFALEDDPLARSSQSLLQYLQGRVAGLQINTAGGGSASWRGSATSFFLNETTVDLGTIQSISMADVAYVKVFRPPFFGAAGGGSGGAIAVYTRKGASDNPAFKGLPSAAISGYSAIREFYAPDYANTDEADSKDLRTTLYWNPHIYLEKSNRRVIIPFYNSDHCKRIRIVVEGINEQGLFTREEKIIE
jgi:hypothetical protein